MFFMFIATFGKLLFYKNIQFGLLLSGIPPSGHDVINLANTFHLLGHELPGTNTVLAPLCPQHLLEQRVGANHLVGCHHLPPIGCDLLKLLAHGELHLGGLYEALLLHGPVVTIVLSDGHKRLRLVSKLSCHIANPKSPHECLKVLTLCELPFALNQISCHLEKLLWIIISNVCNTKCSVFFKE